MKMKNILSENMRRFGTKNLDENLREKQNRVEYTQSSGEVVNMFNSGEIKGRWHFDQENSRLCIQAISRRSWCLTDAGPSSDFDSTKFSSGERGTFTIERNDDGSTTLKIK